MRQEPPVSHFESRPEQKKQFEKSAITTEVITANSSSRRDLASAHEKAFRIWDISRDIAGKTFRINDVGDKRRKETL
jgi:hypothetical protein